MTAAALIEMTKNVVGDFMGNRAHLVSFRFFLHAREIQKNKWQLHGHKIIITDLLGLFR